MTKYSTELSEVYVRNRGIALFWPRHVATTKSCRTYVVPQLVLPFRMAGIKSVVPCRGVRQEWAVL